MAATRNLKSFRKFTVKNPEIGLRWIKYRSEQVTRSRKDKDGNRIVEELPPNGFKDAFVFVAGRWYVDEDRFWEIVESQNGGPDAKRQAS